MGKFYVELALCACLLPGCTSGQSGRQDTPDAPLPVTQATVPVPPVVAEAPLRVIVTFVNAWDFQSEDVLQMLKKQSQSRQVTYVSALRGNTHIYLIEPTRGQSESQVLQRLQNAPFIRSAEIDRIARAS